MPRGLVTKSDQKPPSKLMREKPEMIHFDRARPDEFASDEAVREQVIRFRAGNIGRHKAADHEKEKRR